jgi:hypothetical protein
LGTQGRLIGLSECSKLSLGPAMESASTALAG